MKLYGTTTEIITKRALSIAREKNCMSMPQLIGFQQFAQEQRMVPIGRAHARENP